ncbi:hypothetical protein [Caldimonas brevitalea]
MSVFVMTVFVAVMAVVMPAASVIITAAAMTAVVVAIMIPIAVVMMVVPTVVLAVAIVVFHEVDRRAARVVLPAVLAPVLGMPGGHVHVDRLWRHPGALDDHRLRVDHRRRRRMADVDAAVQARLADAHRHTDIRRSSHAGGTGQEENDEG